MSHLTTSRESTGLSAVAISVLWEHAPARAQLSWNLAMTAGEKAKEKFGPEGFSIVCMTPSPALQPKPTAQQTINRTVRAHSGVHDRLSGTCQRAVAAGIRAPHGCHSCSCVCKCHSCK